MRLTHVVPQFFVEKGVIVDFLFLGRSPILLYVTSFLKTRGGSLDRVIYSFQPPVIVSLVFTARGFTIFTVSRLQLRDTRTDIIKKTVPSRFLVRSITASRSSNVVLIV